ncbi:UNVERIFIED_CONTAM: Receptor-like protein 4 [Sesamum radiatum]|uniref:Receptor-like protein 4 n=1 Tax=Sesamum radiatum TaxID=300843 RepID=A0AAW2V733_SESRA
MSLLLLFLFLSLLPSFSLSSPFNYSLHIDCGGLVNSTDAFRTTWLSDRFYSGGATSVVSEPLRFLHQQEKTLRYFPISSGKKNCYSIPTDSAGGRYLLRAFTVYDNYDGKSHSPSFDVSVEGTLVFSWRSPWPESVSRSGAYSDLFFYHDEPVVDVCFYSIATDSPAIGSLELTQIDPKAYSFEYAKNSSNYILVNYGRFSSGSDQWGPGFSNDTDFFGWLTTLNVRLESVVGAPIICGLENYAIVPVDLKTIPDQVTAMRALKSSLRVPDRMGWNGDPCAPTTWDAWEGVTCHLAKDESALVVSQIDLGSQGLKGYISDQISLLTNLVSLNLSSNSLGGSIPSGLGQKSLVKLFLNDNLLEGQVPEEIYSIGVHGGAIDLAGNKGLCGVPSLPNCPLFWGKHGLSTGGKVGIALSCLLVLSALLFGIYYCVIRRRRNDYDFGLPHELMSLAAKRNRYHRQKSLMALEMESQHAKGFIPTYNRRKLQRPNNPRAFAVYSRACVRN